MASRQIPDPAVDSLLTLFDEAGWVFKHKRGAAERMIAAVAPHLHVECEQRVPFPPLLSVPSSSGEGALRELERWAEERRHRAHLNAEPIVEGTFRAFLARIRSLLPDTQESKD